MAAHHWYCHLQAFHCRSSHMPRSYMHGQHARQKYPCQTPCAPTACQESAHACPGSTPRMSPTKASARTTSSFVTPSSFAGLYMPTPQSPAAIKPLVEVPHQALLLRAPHRCAGMPRGEWQGFGQVACRLARIKNNAFQKVVQVLGLGNTPAFLKTSAAMGTVELTGLLMMATQALGQYLAMPSHSVCTMPAPAQSPLTNRNSPVLSGPATSSSQLVRGENKVQVWQP